MSSISVVDCGAIGDGVTDNAQAFLDAFTAAHGSSVYVPAGRYLVEDLTVTSSLRLTGEGTILQPSGATCFLFDPAWGTAQSVTSISDQTRNSKVVSRLNGSFSGVSRGDILKVYSEDEYPWVAQVWMGELAAVVEVAGDGSWIDLDHKLFDAFATDIKFRKLPTERFELDGISFEATGGDVWDAGVTDRQPLVRVRGCVNPIVRNVIINSAWERGFQFDNCWMGELEVRGENLPDIEASNAFGYLVDVSRASHGCRVQVHSRWARHAVTSGYQVTGTFDVNEYKDFGAPKCVVVHDSVAVGLFGGAAFDTHAGARDWVFDNCWVYHPTPAPTSPAGGKAFQDRGLNTTIQNCGVFNSNAGIVVDGGVVDHGELNTTRIVNFTCWNITVGSPITIGSGAANNHQTVIDGANVSDISTTCVNIGSGAGRVFVRNLHIFKPSNFCKAVNMSGTSTGRVAFIDGLFMYVVSGDSADPPITTAGGGTIYAQNVHVHRESSSPSGFAINTDSGNALSLYAENFTSNGALAIKHSSSQTINLIQMERPLHNVKEFFAGTKIVTGSGSPESSITAPIGSIFLRTDGGSRTSLYVKESGAGNTGWRLVAAETVSADKGDAAATLTWGTDPAVNVWNTALTATRAVTLSGGVNGAKFRVVRTAAATGGSALDVGSGPLKALAVGQWCEVHHNGSAWFLSAFGSL